MLPLLFVSCSSTCPSFSYTQSVKKEHEKFVLEFQSHGQWLTRKTSLFSWNFRLLIFIHDIHKIRDIMMGPSREWEITSLRKLSSVCTFHTFRFSCSSCLFSTISHATTKKQTWRWTEKCKTGNIMTRAEHKYPFPRKYFVKIIFPFHFTLISRNSNFSICMLRLKTLVS